MALFGKKKEVGAGPGMPPAGPEPGEETPTALVIQMRRQGLTNNQIVQTLQREGYSSSQIFDAMSQADIKGIVEKPGRAAEAGPAPAMPPPMPSPSPSSSERPLAPPLGPPEAPPGAPGTVGAEEIEEIAESIIDEKWEELMKAVDKIVAWKESTEAKVAQMEQKMEDLRKEFDTLHKGVLGKIEEYDKDIKDVGTDIRAMEAVFKKTLPTFTENIHELQSLTKKIKSRPKKKSI